MRDQVWNLAVIVLLTCVASVCLGDELLRDPTRPYTASERIAAVAPRFVVNAIIVSPERQVAIVNGQRVGIGGSVDNATVISIDKDKLILEINGKRQTARLHRGVSRQ
ncbi:MAG: hypothetical protein GY783_02000 [Gammaproteobacteria bacterium]|nr:hypothetical protein [Gammaproteobacteria bacterium]